MKVAGLFAGIGGIEFGLHKNGMETIQLCEILDEAQHVLNNNFNTTLLSADIRNLNRLEKIDLVAAGFPCQNLSIAGNKSGITGAESALVNEVFRLLDAKKRQTSQLCFNRKCCQYFVTK